MDQRTLEHFKQRLQEQRAQIQAQLAEDQSDDPATPGAATSDHAQWEKPGFKNHFADDATELFIQEEEMTIDNSMRGMLDEIDRALGRIEDGSYGTCEVCGKPIPLPRLEARPASTLCLEDKAKAEQAVQQHRAAAAARQNIQ